MFSVCVFKNKKTTIASYYFVAWQHQNSVLIMSNPMFNNNKKWVPEMMNIVTLFLIYI